MTNIHMKPLATSSPLDKILTFKVKKTTNKIIHETNEKNHDGVSNNKKKTKLQQIPEIDKGSCYNSINEIILSNK